MKMLITVFSLALLVSSCSYFKHKEDCAKEGHKDCDSKCKHEEGKTCPMHAAPAAQVSEQTAPEATPTPAPAKKKKK